jgi:hypothetical protein
MNKLIFLLLFFALSGMVSLYAQQAQAKTSQREGVSFPDGEKFKDAKITYTIIPAANNTWCYDILVDGRLFIHQSSVPGLPRNEGFKTKEAAAAVAELVIGKINKGEMPPGVTIEEMKKINAI